VRERYQERGGKEKKKDNGLLCIRYVRYILEEFSRRRVLLPIFIPLTPSPFSLLTLSLSLSLSAIYRSEFGPGARGYPRFSFPIFFAQSSVLSPFSLLAFSLFLSLSVLRARRSFTAP